MAEKLFPHTKGGITMYCGGDDAAITDARFVLGIFGEDANKIVAACSRERRGDFVLVPLFAYGSAPRAELCSKASLMAALEVAQIEPGSVTEQQWRKACDHHGVPWPERLAA
jgi:hypothetical protein